MTEPRSRAESRVINQKASRGSSCVMFHGIYSRTLGSFFSSIASSSPRTAMSAKQIVDEAVAGHKIVIFSKSYCPYCKRAKNLFNSDFANLKDQIYIKEYAPSLLRSFPRCSP